MGEKFKRAKWKFSPAMIVLILQISLPWLAIFTFLELFWKCINSKGIGQEVLGSRWTEPVRPISGPTPPSFLHNWFPLSELSFFRVVQFAGMKAHYPSFVSCPVKRTIRQSILHYTGIGNSSFSRIATSWSGEIVWKQENIPLQSLPSSIIHTSSLGRKAAKSRKMHIAQSTLIQSERDGGGVRTISSRNEGGSADTAETSVFIRQLGRQTKPAWICARRNDQTCLQVCTTHLFTHKLFGCRGSLNDNYFDEQRGRQMNTESVFDRIRFPNEMQEYATFLQLKWIR